MYQFTITFRSSVYHSKFAILVKAAESHQKAIEIAIQRANDENRHFDFIEVFVNV